MKIIKRRKRPKKQLWAKEFVCTGRGAGGGGCGSTLLVTEEDIYRCYETHYDGSSETYFSFTCPCCGKESEIDAYVWPANVEITQSREDWKLKNKKKGK